VRNGNGSYGTEEWQWYNGTAQRNGETATAKWQRLNGNGMLEARHNCNPSPLVQ